MSEHDRRVRLEEAIREELERDHQDWCHIFVGCCPRCVCDLPERILATVVATQNREALRHEADVGGAEILRAARRARDAD